MKYDEIWWNMVNNEIWWNMMKYDEMWWNVMKCDEMWWNVMKCDEIWWNVMKCDEMWWNVMKYDEMWWNVMKCDEMWWNVMKYDEMWWNTMKYDESMKYDEMWCNMMRYDEIWWRLKSDMPVSDHSLSSLIIKIDFTKMQIKWPSLNSSNVPRTSFSTAQGLGRAVWSDQSDTEQDEMAGFQNSWLSSSWTHLTKQKCEPHTELSLDTSFSQARLKQSWLEQKTEQSHWPLHTGNMSRLKAVEKGGSQTHPVPFRYRVGGMGEENLGLVLITATWSPNGIRADVLSEHQCKFDQTTQTSNINIKR